jgi:hypothetical protein
VRGVALHHACHAGQIGSVELLLRAGCDIHAENAVGETAADLAAAAGYRDELLVVLGQAAAGGEVATTPPEAGDAGRSGGATATAAGGAGVGWQQQQHELAEHGGGGVAGSAASAASAAAVTVVSRSCACIGSRCLRQCGDGASIGGADRAHRAAPRAGVCAYPAARHRPAGAPFGGWDGGRSIHRLRKPSN